MIIQGILMLEVRTFDSSPEELSDFVFTQWQASYRGRMAVPRWSGDYFRWQLRMDEPEHRRHVIAAYDGARLAGVVPYFPVQYSLDGERFAASQASWLSVVPEFRGQGVAGKMVQASRAVAHLLSGRHRSAACGAATTVTHAGVPDALIELIRDKVTIESSRKQSELCSPQNRHPTSSSMMRLGVKLEIWHFVNTTRQRC